MNLDLLAHAIDRIHTTAQSRAGQAINQVLNWRNWLIGAYIIEFEQGGEDRAEYGDGILRELARRLKDFGTSGLSLTNLKGFRKIALTWPLLPIGQTPSDLFKGQIGENLTDFPENGNRQTASAESVGKEKSQTPSNSCRHPATAPVYRCRRI